MMYNILKVHRFLHISWLFANHTEKQGGMQRRKTWVHVDLASPWQSILEKTTAFLTHAGVNLCNWPCTRPSGRQQATGRTSETKDKPTITNPYRDRGAVSVRSEKKQQTLLLSLNPFTSGCRDSLRSGTGSVSSQHAVPALGTGSHVGSPRCTTPCSLCPSFHTAPPPASCAWALLTALLNVIPEWQTEQESGTHAHVHASSVEPPLVWGGADLLSTPAWGWV